MLFVHEGYLIYCICSCILLCYVKLCFLRYLIFVRWKQIMCQNKQINSLYKRYCYIKCIHVFIINKIRLVYFAFQKIYSKLFNVCGAFTILSNSVLNIMWQLERPWFLSIKLGNHCPFYSSYVNLSNKTYVKVDSLCVLIC